MESILCIDIPVQMISCTDTDGTITPMRFRFRDNTGEIITICIEEILSSDQDRNRMGINFFCTAPVHGTQKKFNLWYSFTAHEWRMSRLYT